MLVFKVILRTLRKQCRHLAEKKIDQRLINLRSMSKNNGEKYLRKIFSPQTDLIDKQKAVLTSGLTKFRRNDIQKLLNAQWWKKKNFFKKNFFKKCSWIRGKQMSQICRLFFWQKKPLFLRSILEEHEKNKQHLCQNNVLSSNFSSGLVECSFVKLTERFSEKNQTNFCWMSVNDGEKIFDKHFSPETGLIDKQKTVLTKGATIFRRNDRQMSINAQWSNKKKLFEKKIPAKYPHGHVVSNFDNPVDCFPKKSLDLLAQGPQRINKSNKSLSKRP